jgi:hypothetical protein
VTFSPPIFDGSEVPTFVFLYFCCGVVPPMESANSRIHTDGFRPIRMDEQNDQGERKSEGRTLHGMYGTYIWTRHGRGPCRPPKDNLAPSSFQVPSLLKKVANVLGPLRFGKVPKS